MCHIMETQDTHLHTSATVVSPTIIMQIVLRIEVLVCPMKGGVHNIVIAALLLHTHLLIVGYYCLAAVTKLPLQPTY